MSRTDVVIVGAGPTGLLLAGDLAEAGRTVTVLEKRSGTSNLTRAFAVHARTLEALDARGLADELVATGNTVPSLRLFNRMNLRLDGIPSRYPFALITPQYNTEDLLRRRARDAGASILSGQTVVDVEQDADGATVVAETESGVVHHRASYVVGADGVRSSVRSAVGLSFEGRTAVRSMVLADVVFADPPTETVTVNGTAEGFVFIAPFGDGSHRVIARAAGDDRGDDVPVDAEEVRELLNRVCGNDFGLAEVRWTSRFHSDERQAPRYRVGRVFLAGDAAHVHSPAGGQGMNVGLLDAANLAWKLAAVLDGWAAPGLLDSYNAERHPIGRMVIRASGALIRAALTGSGLVRGVRNVMVPLALSVPLVRGRIAGTLSGVGVRLPAPSGLADAGRRAEDIPLRPDGSDGATRLAEAARSGQFVYIAPSGEDYPRELDGHVVVVRPVDDSTPAMLVRPDGYIAWSQRDGGAPRWSGTFLTATD